MTRDQLLEKIELENKVESLECHIVSQNKIITYLYELFKYKEMPHWLRKYSERTSHNRKTIEYLDARIKAEILGKELNL